MCQQIEKKPTEQLAHTDKLVAPTMVENFPDGQNIEHTETVEAPVIFPADPGGQGLQDALFNASAPE